MPTSRPRHLVTETEDLALALDAAAARWPGISRSRLLSRLALEGHRALKAESEDRCAARRTALERHAGVASGSYSADYLEQLRGEWPS